MPLVTDRQTLVLAQRKPFFGSMYISSKKDPFKKFHHIPGLDNIRGFAVSFVLMLHLSYGMVKGGWLGVEIFFVLSGYLITSILQTEYRHFGRIAIRRFYIRRALRLFPPLLIAVILANILWVYNDDQYPYAVRSWATLGSLFYFVNLLPEKISGSLVHLWSLAVEEHFYLLWPFFASFLFRFSRKKQAIILSAVILLVSVYRVLQAAYDPQLNSMLIIIDSARFTFCSIDGILVGALMAIVLPKPRFNNFRMSRKNADLLIAAMCIAITYLLFKLSGNSFYLSGGFLFLDFFCAIAIYLAIKNPHHYLFSNKVISWLGTRSYGIYIYHYIIFASLEHFRHHDSNTNMVLVSIVRIVVSLAFAELSFRYIEQPFARSTFVSKLKHLFPHKHVAKQPTANMQPTSVNL